MNLYSGTQYVGVEAGPSRENLNSITRVYRKVMQGLVYGFPRRLLLGNGVNRSRLLSRSLGTSSLALVRQDTKIIICCYVINYLP